jgi:hypothetical protein
MLTCWAEYFVSTKDVALLHLACLIDPEVKDERVLAYAEPYNWNQVLAIFRKMHPEKKFVDDLEDQGADKSVVDTKRSEEILRRMTADKGGKGGRGFEGLEDSLRETVQGLASSNDLNLATGK